MERPDFTDQILRETTYPPEENFPVASEYAQKYANNIATLLFYSTDILPYFDVCLDTGVNIYYDYKEDELEIHLPPAGSSNFYCFTRINGERKVTRTPTYQECIEYLKQLGHNKTEE
jgi:hypothetical protein